MHAHKHAHMYVHYTEVQVYKFIALAYMTIYVKIIHMYTQKLAYTQGYMHIDTHTHSNA